MLLELAVALSLTQIQDTCVIDANSVFTRACHVACAGNFNTWDDVIAFRHIANKEGFGSTTILLPDSTYELSFVLFGDSSTVYSQWVRLNELLGLNLSLRKPIVDKVEPEETILITSLPPRVPTLKLNVSAWDQPVLIKEPPAPYMKEDTIKLVEAVPNSALHELEKESFIPDEETLTTVESGQIDFEVKLEVKDSIFTQGLKTYLDSSNVDENQEISDDKDFVAIVEAKLTESRSINKKDQIEESVLTSQYLLQEQIYDSAASELSREKDLFTNYLIVFGSYWDRQSALKHRNELHSQGILAVIKPHKSYFRVGVYYDYYPNKELAKFKKSHPPCWVTTIKTK